MQFIKQAIKSSVNFFDRLPLYARFGVALLLPVIVIVWISVFNILELRQSVAQLSRLTTDLKLVTEAGQLVGNLQQERGYSVLSLKSGDPKFQQRLSTSRQASSQQLQQLQQALAETPVDDQQSAIYKNLVEILRSLARLDDIRERVDNRSVTAGQIVGYFSAPVDQFNAQISRLSRDTNVSSFARQLNAYFILNRLRELLGQERVLIGTALSDGSIEHHQLRDLIYLTGRQHSLLVGLQNQTQYADKINLVATSTDLRAELVESEQPARLLSETELGNWFVQQTKLIEQVQQVENRIIASIQQQAGDAYASAHNELWRYVIISPLALFSSLFFAWLIVRFVKRRMLLLDKVFMHSHDRITVSDAEGNIVDVNPAFTRMTGYSKEEVLGRNPRFLQSGRQDKAFYKAMWNSITRHGVWQGELWNRRKDGELYAELSSISAIRDNHGQIQNFISMSSDITERAVAHQRELEHQAYHDALTGLPNVMLVRDRLEHALSLASRGTEKVVVASLDIDNFKRINSRFGHVIGDKTIECMANRLRAMLRDGDTLGRVSGDEFILIIEGEKNQRNIADLLDRIRRRASQPMSIDDRDVVITVSLGATQYPEDNHDADTLIRHATQALHLSKRKGRDQVNWFDAEREHEQTQLTQLIKDLKGAMHQQQLVLYYQPKVDIRTCRIVGAEALLRWQRADGSLVPPGDFLPHIENHPFSIEVGDYVINQALSQIETWQQQGIELPVSVNVSAQQLLADGFVESLQRQLNRYPKVAASAFEIEILESAAIGKIDDAAKVIERCKALGVSVSLDDFGTGYAALDYLKRLPAQVLKIDQSFVRDMQRDDADMAIVKGIIGLARAFGFDVIAEGVETPEQGQVLIELGCYVGQGYGIARPMPAAELPQWLNTWKCPDGWHS